MSRVGVGGVRVMGLEWRWRDTRKARGNRLWRGSGEPCAARGASLLDQASGIVHLIGIGVEVRAVAGTGQGFTPLSWRYRFLEIWVSGSPLAVSCMGIRGKVRIELESPER